MFSIHVCLTQPQFTPMEAGRNRWGGKKNGILR